MTKSINKADPFNFDDYRQQVPAFFYKRFRKDNPTTNIESPETWVIPLDFGYGYLLRMITSKWPMYESQSASIYPTLNISLFNTIRGATRQNNPIPLRLVSTPGKDGCFRFPAPAPVDNDIFNICYSATPPLKNRLVYNLFYQYRDAIHMKFNFSPELPTQFHEIEYFDIMLDGYLIPEKDLSLWK